MKNGGGVGKNVKSIYAKSRTEILAILWSFGSFHGIKLLNSMQFSYKLVCPSILIQMRGKISLKVISQNTRAKWPSYGPKWPVPLWRRAWYGHNLAIFHPILTNEYTKMTSKSRRIEWNKNLSSISLIKILVFGPHFCSKASHGQCCTYGLKITLEFLVHVLAIMANSYLKIVFSQK